MEMILQWALPMLEQYSAQYPWLFVVVTIMGSFRLFFKPVVTIAQNIVYLTPSRKDDEFFQKMLVSKWYKGFSFFVDWVASVKLPKK